MSQQEAVTLPVFGDSTHSQVHAPPLFSTPSEWKKSIKASGSAGDCKQRAKYAIFLEVITVQSCFAGVEDETWSS